MPHRSASRRRRPAPHELAVTTNDPGVQSFVTAKYLTELRGYERKMRGLAAEAAEVFGR